MLYCYICIKKDMVNFSCNKIDFNDYCNPDLKGRIDLIFADPPYGVTNLGYDKCKFDLSSFWEFVLYYIKTDGVVIISSVIQFAVDLIQTAPKGWFRYDIIWEKTSPTGFLNAKKRPLRAHEILLVFSPSGTHCYNPQMTHGHKRKVSSASSKVNCKKSELYNKADNYSDYDSTDRYPRSVIKFASDKQKLNIHPNQKPVALLEWIIRTYSNEGDLVMDPVAGSGTTGIACIHTGRDFILIEKDPDYYRLMADRLEKERNN